MLELLLEVKDENLNQGKGRNCSLSDNLHGFGLGNNSYGKHGALGLSNVMAIATGGWYSLALRLNGGAAAWGDTGSRETR